MAGDQAESDDSTDAPEGFQPKSPAMKRWKKRYFDHEDVDSSTTEETDENNSNEVVQPLVSDANLQFRGFCQLLIAMAVMGAIFSLSLIHI